MERLRHEGEEEEIAEEGKKDEAKEREEAVCFFFTESRGQRSGNQKRPFIGDIIKPGGARRCSQPAVRLC